MIVEQTNLYVVQKDPIIDTLNTAYSKVMLEQQLCVDEHMCSTKARNMLKRYNPNKPHKRGYKIYVLSGVSGFAYKTEVETGTENIVNQGAPDLGASSKCRNEVVTHDS
ncbi:hypothetical protein MSG28_016202 [Choristoneura fumiferana]|uniref:Uncharacterized protein n=1 Tax=Choristoneura fumiferana TaxID=7141 RepID=A0ACC0K690_CHOFU|nr:hypothetical protein MSG28_016202 [Choristoneura fumiferana]